MQRLPNFLIIGEMKCGTTTLWKLLAQDSRLFFPDLKELHYFGSYSYFGASGPDNLGDLDAYARHFADADPSAICGEATPNYLVDRLAPERIKATLPNAKLVALVRDPIGRTWSHYWHQVRRGWEPLKFEDALDAEPARLAEGDDSREKFSYLLRSRYIENLCRYENVFGRDALCVVFFEELINNPQATAERVWRHLGCMPPYPQIGKAPHENRASYPRSAVVSRLTQRAMRWARGRGGVVLAAAKRAREVARPFVYYEGGSRMSQEVRARLETKFRESDRELAAWLDRPLPWRSDTVSDRSVG